MKTRLNEILLPGQYGEIVVSNENNRLSIHRAVKAGRLRKIAHRVYTSNFKDTPEKIVRANCWILAGAFFPSAMIVDRTALEQRPAEDGSIFLITESRSTNLKLPGITFRPRSGPAPIEGYDRPFLAGLWMSSQPRALLDNLRLTRQRSHMRRTFSREELEEYIDKILRNSGETVLNKLRDQAQDIASQLGMEVEAKNLSSIIGSMMGTKNEPLLSDLGISRSKGLGYDKDRLILFEQLRGILAQHPFADRWMRENSTYLPFFESYFSNFIEGTEFDVEEAHDIIFNGKIPQERSEDAHDVLGTFQIVSDAVEMSHTANNAKEFIDLLRHRHAIVLAGRIDKNPGQFKQHINRAGESRFVNPELVLGTLHRGFELLLTLQHPMARAIYVMFLVAEVHPFSDGNGRISRIMMNAELHKESYERIIIPSVYRMEYLQSLRALTHNQRADALISVMDYAQRFVSKINFSDYQQAVKQLKTCHAFGQPSDAMGSGDKLVIL